jgi:hypothetical protein
VWAKAQAQLKQALERMRTLHRTTERQALEQAREVLVKAQQAFEAAYRRQKGPGYEEGKVFLTRANNQIKQLRKKVKGY